MSQRHLLALFNGFDEAVAAISELRAANIKGFDFDDLILKSPIEHPEVETVLGDRPIKVQWFTLAGACMGGLLALLWLQVPRQTFPDKGRKTHCPSTTRVCADL